MSARKILGLVNAPGEAASILRTCAALNTGGHTLVLVALNQEIAAGLAREGECRLLREYPVPEDFQRRALQWLDAWAERPVGGRSLKESLWHEGVSLWWFFLPLLAPDLLHCLQYIEAFEAVLDAEKPDLVVVADAHRRPMLPFRLKRAEDLPARVAYLVAASRGYQIHSAGSSTRARLDFCRSYLGRRLLAGLARWVGEGLDRRLRLALVGLGGRGRGAPRGRKKLVLFSTSAYWRQTGEVEEGRRLEGDVFAGQVVRLLGEGGAWSVLDVDTEVNLPSPARYRKLYRKARHGPAPCAPIERYYDRILVRRAREQGARLRAWWQEARGEFAGEEVFAYRGVPLAGLMLGRLDYAFGEYARVVFGHLEAAAAILERERPDAVLIEYEEGSYGRAATVKARQGGVPSVALQHGMHAGPFVPAYYFRQVSWEGEGDRLGCPIPTATALFGEDTRRMLTLVSAYPPASVEVTGSAAHDLLRDQAERLSPGAARKALGVGPEGRVVTVLSSKFLESQHRVWFAETVLGALRELPEPRVIVKLHPHETPELWRATARRLGMPEPLLLRDKLWECLAAAEAVVAWYSTAVLDAMAFARPVVIVQQPGRDRAVKFADERQVQVAGDASQLRGVLAALLEDQELRAELVRRGREILADQVYRLDGGAAARIAALINRLAAAKAGPGEPPDLIPGAVAAQREVV
jgi:hypothetical protein